MRSSGRVLKRQIPQPVGQQFRRSQEESYRVLRSNVSVALSETDHPTLAITSAYAGEGKTSTCVNLARSLAVAGQRVILMDLDLRHPDTHRWLGAHNEFGVADVILDRRTVEDAMQFVEVGKGATKSEQALYLLATGPPVSNPAEFLGTRRMAQLIESLSVQADIVLIDTPPVLPVADTLVIGRMVSGAILVIETRRTPTGAIKQAKDALIRNQTRLFGVVVNKLQARDSDYGYGYGYGYGYEPDEVPAGE
jgi:capsular exopolysaccharide synthesis family protein